MAQTGYFRHPTIAAGQIVFVCEDDLWSVSAAGGLARRLTSGRGAANSPALSPDGRWLAFAGREEGPAEVYVMPAQGGPPRRLTYLGGPLLRVAGWTPQGEITFVSSAAQRHPRLLYPYAVSPEGGRPKRLPTGPAVSLSFGPKGGLVIGRNELDPARWKRYRGGRAGDLWIDPKGDGAFGRLISLPGNLAWPIWLDKRVYFHSDHEGVGNLYSCAPEGTGVRRHTDHADFYLRHPSSDGRQIVYHAGGDLYRFDPAKDHYQKIEIDYPSPRTQRQRRFVKATKHLETHALHPQGHRLAITARGRAFSLGNWEGPALPHGLEAGVRYRLARWLHEGRRIVLVSDANGQETLEVHDAENPDQVRRLSGLELGQVQSLAASPKADAVALTNQRNELIWVDLESARAHVADRSPYGAIGGVAWSPDGRWLAYSAANTPQTRLIKLYSLEEGRACEATSPVLADFAPAFDPDGKYLYFLSARTFNPVYDNLHFDLGFPRGVRPCLVTLQAQTPSPFFVEPKAPEADKEKPDAKNDPPPAEPLRIDVDDIARRVLAFPVPEGRYAQLGATAGKALWTVWPIEGALGHNWQNPVPAAKGKLEVFTFETQKVETLVEGVTGFVLSQDGKTLCYRAGNRLRVQKADAKADEKTARKPPGKDSGWVDLSRLRLEVDPPAEWRQMLVEAWRLQRDNFWDEGMSQVDWAAVLDRYLPLLDRIATRGEFSDLVWEMQGELGTSHAYEFGGDYRPEPHYAMGFLGADLAFDEGAGLWRLARLLLGDPWDAEKTSPLRRPGLNVREGDALLAVDGVPVGAQRAPAELLVQRAGAEVSLTLGDAQGKNPRTVVVKTLRDEQPARYRDWVEANRAFVHARTEGRVGYVHIPDMQAQGYAEFHRGFLAELTRDALIIDVRFNGGGHVSQLLLEKLGRHRIGFDKARWSGVRPFPNESPGGPMVCLTNESAGSDGDIFSHSFKLLGYGPLIGTRTWGGVIGITPTRRLADGGMTSQPEFAFWFEDVGWRVENHGTDPDIEIELRPQDDVAGTDPQLEGALAEALRRLEQSPPLRAEFEAAPSRALPKLPK